MVFRGLIFCNKCGNRGPSKFLNLAQQCREPTDYGIRNLSEIRAGQLPEQLSSWPDEEVPADIKIDRPFSNRDELPPNFSFVRIKRPKSVFNKAGLSNSTSPSSSASARDRAEQALPPQLLNLIELSSLEGSGVQVQWPEGINTRIAHDLIFEFFSPMIEREEISEPIALPDGNINFPVLDSCAISESLRENLQELLSLHDIGETVVWPEGFSPLRAKQVLSLPSSSNQ